MSLSELYFIKLKYFSTDIRCVCIFSNYYNTNTFAEKYRAVNVQSLLKTRCYCIGSTTPVRELDFYNKRQIQLKTIPVHITVKTNKTLTIKLKLCQYSVFDKVFS
jgi:hypothetical protein